MHAASAAYFACVAGDAAEFGRALARAQAHAHTHAHACAHGGDDMRAWAARVGAAALGARAGLWAPYVAHWRALEAAPTPLLARVAAAGDAHMRAAGAKVRSRAKTQHTRAHTRGTRDRSRACLRLQALTLVHNTRAHTHARTHTHTHTHKRTHAHTHTHTHAHTPCPGPRLGVPNDLRPCGVRCARRSGVVAVAPRRGAVGGVRIGVGVGVGRRGGGGARARGARRCGAALLQGGGGAQGVTRHAPRTRTRARA